VIPALGEESSLPSLSSETTAYNGLYSFTSGCLDGIDGGNTGVMVLHDGRIQRRCLFD